MAAAASVCLWAGGAGRGGLCVVGSVAAVQLRRSTASILPAQPTCWEPSSVPPRARDLPASPDSRPGGLRAASEPESGPRRGRSFSQWTPSGCPSWAGLRNGNLAGRHKPGSPRQRRHGISGRHQGPSESLRWMHAERLQSTGPRWAAYVMTIALRLEICEKHLTEEQRSAYKYRSTRQKQKRRLRSSTINAISAQQRPALHLRPHQYHPTLLRRALLRGCALPQQASDSRPRSVDPRRRRHGP